MTRAKPTAQASEAQRRARQILDNHGMSWGRNHAHREWRAGRLPVEVVREVDAIFSKEAVFPCECGR